MLYETGRNIKSQTLIVRDPETNQFIGYSHADAPDCFWPQGGERPACWPSPSDWTNLQAMNYRVSEKSAGAAQQAGIAGIFDKYGTWILAGGALVLALMFTRKKK